MMKTIVTANPGFFLICSDSEDLFLTYPIIAWEIDGDDPTPITPCGRIDSNSWGYLCPNGSVIGPDQTTYSSLEEAQKIHWETHLSNVESSMNKQLVKMGKDKIKIT